jgi:hypothetical protein
MTGTFTVKNFEKFQHYKDRHPPWIKLYNELLDDYEFARLPDASKAHLIAIWLLASRYENKIPLDQEWIARRINATEPIDLNLLLKSGFIEADQDCSKLLADCKHIAIPEREEETEAEREKETPLPPKGGREEKKGTRLPKDWKLTIELIDWAQRELGLDVDQVREGNAEFCDYWWAVPGQRGCKLDWDATWRNSLRRFADKSPKKNRTRTVSEFESSPRSPGINESQDAWLRRITGKSLKKLNA